MVRRALLMTAAVAGLVSAGRIWACADGGSTPSWTLVNRDLSSSDNMALMAPGNDTRVNMILLLSDRDGGFKAKSRVPDTGGLFDYWTVRSMLYSAQDEGSESEERYSYGGSRCDSYDGASADFADALNADKSLNADEKAALMGARKDFTPNCDGTATGTLSTVSGTMASASGKAFATYLAGAEAFYAGDYPKAQRNFAALSGANNGWLKETGAYMAGRVDLNRAITSAFGEWGEFNPEKVDKRAVNDAGKAFAAYLSAYPKGRYAPSAKGLIRRVHWLGGDDNALANDYGALSTETGQMNHARIAEEIDLKLLPILTTNTAADPIILATIDLKRMRSGDSLYGEGLWNSTINLAELEGQRERFSSNPALFEYLVAAHHFYVGNNPKEVLKLIPDAARNSNFSYLDFSRQMLRGLALEATKDRNARGFWLEMISGAKQPMQRQAIELALATHDERAGQVGKVFDTDSQIGSSPIREILLTSVAGPDLLRTQAKNAKTSKRLRDAALFTLLYKSLSRGAYRDFVSDVKMVPQNAASDGYYWGADYSGGEDNADEYPIPVGKFVSGQTSDGYACPKIVETAVTLSVNPKRSSAQLCLGDFLRLNGFDDYWMDGNNVYNPIVPGALGSGKSDFPGTYQSRQSIYQRLIADPSVSADDKAYALYRAVWCYGPSGYNSCGGEDVAKSVRKGWYDRLKRDYPASKWAKSLKYYW